MSTNGTGFLWTKMARSVWSEESRFSLKLEDFENVFTVSAHNIEVKNYASTLAQALSSKIPGRFTSFGAPAKNKNNFVFRFVKSCFSSDGCDKKWKIVCQKESIWEGVNEFIIYSNEATCNHEQPVINRPLSGKKLYSTWDVYFLTYFFS